MRKQVSSRLGWSSLMLSWLVATGSVACAAGEEEPSSLQAPLSSASAGVTAPIIGFADLHLHMMAEAAHGGRWLHGSHDGPLSDCDGGLAARHGALRNDMTSLVARIAACGGLPGPADELLAPAAALLAKGVGGAALSEAIASVPGSQGDTGLHLGRAAYPSGWPAWDTIAHQQAHWQWLRSAQQRGLKLVVMSAVSYDWLCQQLPARGGEGCDEMADIERQLDMAQALDRAHDWLEIALSPEHARRIIAEGKLAMVLSIEASHLFGRDAGRDFVAALDRAFAKGVRTLQPVHETDNRFAGAALHSPVFQLAEFTENCRVDYDCGATSARYTLGFDVERHDGYCRNAVGLKPDGATLVREMMRRGMPIDLAHLSEKATADVIALAEQNTFYPLYVSHGHPREVMQADQASHEKTTPLEVMLALRRSGGMFGLRTFPDETRAYARSSVAASCQGSTRSFAQAHDFLTRGLRVPVAFGSDLNGFIQQTRPRFGADGCSATERGLLADAKLTPFEAQSSCERRDQRASGPAGVGSDFDTKGLAHVGLLPDMLTDLQRVGLDASGLNDSAERFLRMWERARAPRTGPADVGVPVDSAGLSARESPEERQGRYPQQCRKHYCPSHQDLGGECRFNAECGSGACSSPDVTCGVPAGRCVCNDDGDCGAARFCAQATPGIGADNRCEAKRGEHEGCTRDGQCASARCGGCFNIAGWCYTPASKAYDQECRADAECRTGRCSADCVLNPTGRCLCQADSDCGAGRYCGYALNSGVCTTKKKRWQKCLYGRECESGRCGGLCL